MNAVLCAKFKTIGQTLWMNDISRDFSWSWVSNGYPILHCIPGINLLHGVRMVVQEKHICSMYACISYKTSGNGYLPERKSMGVFIRSLYHERCYWNMCVYEPHIAEWRSYPAIIVQTPVTGHSLFQRKWMADNSYGTRIYTFAQGII